jgi:hypothetical protein
VLEDENSETIRKQLALFHERVLPDLGNNIKCGNSLIGPDFYEGQQISFLDEEEMYRINVFDWKAEFSEIMQDGGFDAVIGNPPYVRQELLGSLKSYFQRKYEVYHGVADLYAYFIEKSVSLLRSSGYFAYIVANKWMRANYGKPLRQWLKQQNIVEIIDFGDLPVFKQVTTYPCILVIKKAAPGTQFAATNIRTLDFPDLNACVTENRHEVRQVTLDDNGWALVNEKTQDLLDKLRNTGIPLGKYVNGKIYRGVLTGLNDAFVIDAETRDMLIAEDPKSEDLIKPFLLGRDIKRYRRPHSERYLIFTRRGISIDQYPAIKKYLRQYKERLTPRPANWKGDKWPGRKPGSYQWYEIQDAIDYYNEFEKPKIVLPDISLRGNFALDNEEGTYCVNTAYIISSAEQYLLGILNSSLITFFYKTISSTYRGGYLRFIYQYLVMLPIRTIDFSNPEDKARHDRIVELVDQMLDLHKQLTEAKAPQTKTVLQRRIETTDQQIDRLVYELYGLTTEEIALVEKSVEK